MATKNIVPRGNLEGNLGTEQKRWSGAYVGNLDVSGNINFPNGQITDVATQTEAETGTDNTKGMTPLRTKQLGDKNYLKLSGGTMSGEIITNGVLAKNTISNGRIMLYGGASPIDSAGIYLCGNNDPQNAGQILFSVINSTTNKAMYFQLTPSGHIGWNEKEIATNGALSMPSNNFVSIDVNTTSYTAPADGYLHIVYNANSETAIGQVFLDKSSMPFTTRTYGTKTNLYDCFPMAKGETVTITVFQATITTLRFVYAQSEV